MDERQTRAADAAAVGGVLPETVAAVEDAIAAAGANTLARATFAGPLAVACKRFDILTRQRLAHFAAQLGHESGGFKKLEENLNYSAEALLAKWPVRPPKPGRPDTNYRRYTPELAAQHARKPETIANHIYARPEMLNTQPGDGWRYRGRGLIQLTGRANYRAAGTALGINLESVPDEALKEWNAALIAGWFWARALCNAHADQGEAGLVAITKAINGGRHGLEDRAARYERALAALAAHPETLEN